MASEEEDQDLESLRVAVLASLKTKSQQASPASNDVNSQSPNPETKDSEDKQEEEEQDEDALRRAALKSTKEIRLEDIPTPPTPQPTFQLKGNLIAIQPVPEQPGTAPLNPNDRPKLPRNNKFARFASDDDESNSDSDTDDESSDGDSDDGSENNKMGNSSDSSKSSSSSDDSSSSEGSDHSSRSSSESRSSSSSASSSSPSSSSSSSSSSSDSSDSDSDGSHKDRKRKPSKRESRRKGSISRHNRQEKVRDDQRRDRRKDRHPERSERDRGHNKLIPSSQRRRDARPSRLRTPPRQGSESLSFKGPVPDRSRRDMDRLRTRSRSPRTGREGRGLRTRPDGTRGFGTSETKVPSANEPLESRLRKLAAYESSGSDRKRDTRELQSSRSHRSGEARTERSDRVRNSDNSRKSDEKSTKKLSSPKLKRTSSNSDSDSISHSDISLSDMESDSDKETSRFKHAKGEKPQDELAVRRRQVPRSYRDRFSRDDRRDERRREERHRRDDDRHGDDRRRRDRDRSRDKGRDRDDARRRDTGKHRDPSKSSNGPMSVVQPKSAEEPNTIRIPSLLDIKLRNPHLDPGLRPDLKRTSRLEGNKTNQSRQQRDRSSSAGNKITSPDRLANLEKKFESESGSDGEAVPTGPRSIVKVDSKTKKRRDLKSRLGVRAPVIDQAKSPDAAGQKRDRDTKRQSSSVERERRKRKSGDSRAKDRGQEETRMSVIPKREEPKARGSSPEICITFNEGPPTKKKPIHERLGIKGEAGSKPRRSVKDRLGKKVPNLKKASKDLIPGPAAYDDDDPLEGQVPVQVASKPRQSVIELKTRTKQDAESKRHAEKEKLDVAVKKQKTEGRKQRNNENKPCAKEEKQKQNDVKIREPDSKQEYKSKESAGNQEGIEHANAETKAVDKGDKTSLNVEALSRERKLDENTGPQDDTKNQEVTVVKKKTKIKLRRDSTQKMEGKASLLKENIEEEVFQDVQVSPQREEELHEMGSDGEPSWEDNRSISPHQNDRKVISETQKPSRNIIRSESPRASRQIVYSESEKSSRNVVPADHETSSRKIVHEEPGLLADSRTSQRKIVEVDSRHSRRRVYDSDLDLSRRKIIHGEDPPRRKILRADSDTSRRKVFQSDRDPPRRTVVKDSDMKRGASPSSSYEDIRRSKISRGGEMWKRGNIEEQTREVEIRMEKEERQVIEETREAEAKRLKDEALNARIRKIKEKNAAILQRHQEIEAEKIMFGS